MKLFELAQAQLLRAHTGREHPFRFFQLATFGQYPEIRTVVCRKVELDLTIYFFSDARSPKVTQIEARPEVSAHFWHPGKLLQVRLRGEADVLTGGELYDQFKQLALEQGNPGDYSAAMAPGTPIGAHTEVVLGEQAHFALIRLQPEELDVLQLNQAGHRRALCRPFEGGWQELPIVP